MRSPARLALQHRASLWVLPQVPGPHIAGQSQVHICLGTVTQRWEQGQAGPVLRDHVPSCPFTGLSFFICPRRLLHWLI